MAKKMNPDALEGIVMDEYAVYDPDHGSFLQNLSRLVEARGARREWPDELPDDPEELLEEYIEYKGWEHREAQFGITQDCADEIFAAHEAGDAHEGIDIVVHAPVGTGKSLFAILVIVASRGRGILASSSKSLQAQYMDKDLPDVAKFLKDRYDFDLRFNILKGRSNYANMNNVHIALFGKNQAGHRVEIDEALLRITPKDRETLQHIWDQTTMGMESVEARGDARLLDVGALLDQIEDSRVRYLCSANSPGGKPWSYWEKDPGSSAFFLPIHSFTLMQNTKGVVEGDPFLTAFYAAANSDVAVANHSLVAADVLRCELFESLPGREDTTTIPGFVRGACTIVVDEAQHFPHYVTSSMTKEISLARIRRRAQWCLERSKGKDAVKYRVPEAMKKIMPLIEKAEEFVADTYDQSEGDESDGSVGVLPHESSPKFCEALAGIGSAINAVAEDISVGGFDVGQGKRLPPSVSPIKNELMGSVGGSLAEALLGADLDLNEDPYYEVRISMEDPDDPSTATVYLTPLDISVFRSKLRRQQNADSMLPILGGTSTAFNENRSATLILMSGTISKKTGIRIGMPNPLMSRVDSPFDPNRIKFCVPEDMPEPKSQGWQKIACERVVEAIRAVNGRTMVLCTSRRMQDEFVDAIREGIPGITVISQGETPKDRAVELFSLQENSVLVGVKSFWEGVDVPGTACSLVVMDKIMFPIVDDPIASAMSRAADRVRPGSGFYDVTVDHGAFMLAQGAGRLIRKESDLGGVLILDSRLTSKSYGKALLEMAPQEGRFTPNFDDFLGYLEELREHIEDGEGEPGEPGEEWIPLKKAGVRGGGARPRGGGTTKGKRNFVAVKSQGNKNAKGVAYRK